ncbi:MAG: hypothetical protein GSR72_00010 [Desulfurococcales archaeon]|nr:hypothetical protein [Desulfurococcales archaeon]
MRAGEEAIPYDEAEILARLAYLSVIHLSVDSWIFDDARLCKGLASLRVVEKSLKNIRRYGGELETLEESEEEYSGEEGWGLG